MLRQDTDFQKGLIDLSVYDILYALKEPRGHEHMEVLQS